MTDWQIYFSEIVTGKRKGLFAFLLRGALYILSFGFQWLVACRNWAFDRRYLSRYSPPVPLVISVGNIVAGGTGKTPVTLMLAKEFYPETFLAILSRGYKSKAEKLSTPVVLCRGNGPVYSADYCGDEPFLLAQHLPKALVIVGKNRYAASNMASESGAHLILLDDGMQHRRLARDREVVVVNAQDVFGQGYFLPRGFLREEKTALSRADLVIINHVRDQEHFQTIQQKLLPFTIAPAVGTKMEVASIWGFEKNLISSIQGKKVGIFCGIANPFQFQQTVEMQGAQVVSHKFVSDHESLEIKSLQSFSENCYSLGAEMLLCTEKDFVKLNKMDKFPLPIAWLQMKLTIVEGQGNWHAFIKQAKEALARRI